VQALFLAFHIFYDNIVDIALAGAIFQNLPGLVGVVVNFDEVFIADGQKAVALDVLRDVIMNGIFGQIVTLDEQLCIKPVFQHWKTPFNAWDSLIIQKGETVDKGRKYRMEYRDFNEI
jgi:ethanolamine transporter EutH